MARRPNYATWWRAELVAELRRVAAAARGRPVHARDLPRGLWAALRSRFGSMERARRAAGIESPRGPLRWSEAEVLKDLRRLARQGVVLSDRGLSDAGRRDLVGAVRAYFGSIVRARAIAGVPHPPRPTGKREKWDDARVIREILECHEEGLPLAKARAPQRLIRAGQRYFGSWRDAIEAAGLDYDEVRLMREPYTAGEIVEHLKQLAITRPDMTWAEVADEKFYPAIARLFGSLDDALARAGLEDWPLRLRERLLERAAVIDELRARRLDGRPTHFTAVQDEDGPLWYSAMTHFGSWDAALSAADLAPDGPQRRWSRGALLDAIRDRARLGLSVRPGDVGREDPASTSPPGSTSAPSRRQCDSQACRSLPADIRSDRGIRHSANPTAVWRCSPDVARARDAGHRRKIRAASPAILRPPFVTGRRVGHPEGVKLATHV